MSRKTRKVEVRLSVSEHNSLMEKVNRSGLSASAFIRLAVAGVPIHEAPSVDVPQLIREVRRVGNNINQIQMYLIISAAQAFTIAPFINMLFALGEEVGWRGGMTPYLKEKFGTARGRFGVLPVKRTVNN